MRRAHAQAPRPSSVAGAVRDQTGGALPGVTVELLAGRAVVVTGQTDGSGRYLFDNVQPGTYILSFRLLNFGEQQRPNVAVAAGARERCAHVVRHAVPLHVRTVRKVAEAALEAAAVRALTRVREHVPLERRVLRKQAVAATSATIESARAGV